MTPAMAMPGDAAETFLVHFFGSGLKPKFPRDASTQRRHETGMYVACHGPRVPSWGRNGRDLSYVNGK